MRREFVIAGVVALLVMAAATMQAQEQMPAKEKMPPKATPAAFAQMKSLAGEWNGVADNGTTLTNTIRLVSNGKAVEESFQHGTGMQMVSVYTPDGNKLAMTHYCDAGNQPRMATPPLKGTETEFPFSMTGITNLASPEEGHMVGLTIKIDDKDHFTELWTWKQEGKTGTTLFHFSRKGCVETKPCSVGM